MAVVTIDNLTKVYGTTRALDGASWSLSKGQLLGFLGPNGAGKTTTIRILMGFLRPGDGSATVFGLDSWRRSTEIRRRVGYLPGDVRLYDHLTAMQTIAFVARARGLADHKEAMRLAERFDLDVTRRVRGFSKGMRQKLGIIVALMHRPELLILDEPSASLDPLMQQALYQELRSAKSEGRTVLFSSHSLPEVEALCDDVVILRAGRVVAAKPVAELRGSTGQSVKLRFARSVDIEASRPDGLTIKTFQNGSLEGHWRGSPDELLKWLALQPIDEIVIQPPDLEDLFLGFYGAGRSESE